MNNKFLKAIYHLFAGIVSALMGTFILSWPMLFISLKLEKLPQLVDMSVSKIMHNYNQLMGFLLLPWVKKLKMDDFPSSMSGISHFYEVKVLFQIVLTVFILVIFLRILAARAHFDFQTDKFWLYFWMIIPLAILPMAAMNFDAFFVFFHGIFFHNSDWLFDPATDPIINVLSENFFAACFVSFALLYELYFAITIYFQKKKQLH